MVRTERKRRKLHAVHAVHAHGADTGMALAFACKQRSAGLPLRTEQERQTKGVAVQRRTNAVIIQHAPQICRVVQPATSKRPAAPTPTPHQDVHPVDFKKNTFLGRCRNPHFCKSSTLSKEIDHLDLGFGFSIQRST